MADIDITGFNLLKDMSDEELIEEILTHQRHELKEHYKRKGLIEAVINFRLHSFKHRLMDESGVDWGMPGFMGLFGTGEDGE